MKRKKKLIVKQSRRSNSQRRERAGQANRLLTELLEERRLLAGHQGLAHDMQPEPQLVYLDFDGEEDVTYRGDIRIENIDVPAFQFGERNIETFTCEVQHTLNERVDGAFFTTRKPSGDRPYSTVFIGGDDSAFGLRGTLNGVAEKVDHGNLDPTDNAFVFSEVIADNTSTGEQFVSRLISTIDHEVRHLLGTLDHGEHTGSEHPFSSVADVVRTGTPQWVPQGPSNTTSTAGITAPDPLEFGIHAANSSFIGAIQSVAVHPKNPSKVYVGSVNGGVWRTDNINQQRILDARIDVEVIDDDALFIGVAADVLSLNGTFDILAGDALVSSNVPVATSSGPIALQNDIKAMLIQVAPNQDVVRRSLSQPGAGVVISREGTLRIAINFVKVGFEEADVTVLDEFARSISFVGDQLSFVQPAPVWTRVTGMDEMPTLAIGALEFDPATTADRTILYAGTGTFSNANEGGPALGIYRIEETPDATEVTLIGGDNLNSTSGRIDRQVAKIIAVSRGDAGTELLVATVSGKDGDNDQGGMFRSVGALDRPDSLPA